MSFELLQHEWKSRPGDQKMLWEHEPTGESFISTAFSNSQKLSQEFLQLEGNAENIFHLISFRKHRVKLRSSVTVCFQYQNITSFLEPALPKQRSGKQQEMSSSDCHQICARQA